MRSVFVLGFLHSFNLFIVSLLVQRYSVAHDHVVCTAYMWSSVWYSYGKILIVAATHRVTSTASNPLTHVLGPLMMVLGALVTRGGMECEDDYTHLYVVLTWYLYSLVPLFTTLFAWTLSVVSCCVGMQSLLPFES